MIVCFMVFRGQPRHSDRHLRSCPLTRQLPLSPLHPTRSALFFAMERSQALSHQSLAHSFPCNGGGRVSVQGLSVAARLPHLPRASEGASSGSSPWSGFLCFQQLTYPKRIGHPERSEGSLLISFQQLTNCSELSPDSGFLCFHTFANRPICKPFVLIKLQQYPRMCGDFNQLAPTLPRGSRGCLPRGHKRLQIRPFIFRQMQDAPPATPSLSRFCIVARGWWVPRFYSHESPASAVRSESVPSLSRGGTLVPRIGRRPARGFISIFEFPISSFVQEGELRT